MLTPTRLKNELQGFKKSLENLIKAIDKMLNIIE